MSPNHRDHTKAMRYGYTSSANIVPYFNPRNGAGLRLGYVTYDGYSLLGAARIKISGGNIGSSVGLGFGMALAKSLTLSAGLGLIASTLTKLEITENGYRRPIKQEEDQEESLDYAQVIAGLHWYFGIFNKRADDR